jgi:hypothetical protein
MTPQHEGVIALSTKPALADRPEPAVVNMHPGPDFPYLNEAAA